MDKHSHAQAIYEAGMERVANTPMPEGQKFAPGTRVYVAKDLGPMMPHFPNDVTATVQYTHAHAYGGEDIQSYSLMIDGFGSIAWYEEWQLTRIQ